MKILVTGAKGMIGSYLVCSLLSAGFEVVGVDLKAENWVEGNLKLIKADLGDRSVLERIIAENRVDRIIHLAALAHLVGKKDFTWEEYYYVNVECAENVFQSAGKVPVLFISTVDVYGFAKGGVISPGGEVKPVSRYAKSKVMAEEICKMLPQYTIFRLSPVYTLENVRDIQKRYYLKYPQIAYKVGKGTEYEVLDIKRAVKEMIQWCEGEPQNEIRIIRDPVLLNTAKYIQKEKQAGRAKCVLWLPKRIVLYGYQIIHFVLGETAFVYLLYKVVNPYKTID